MATCDPRDIINSVGNCSTSLTIDNNGYWINGTHYEFGDKIVVNNPIITTTNGTSTIPNLIPANQNNDYFTSFDPIEELKKFLLEYETPDFQKSFDVYIKNNPKATPQEMFVAAMKIGFAIAKLRTDDKIKINYDFNQAGQFVTYTTQNNVISSTIPLP